MRSILVVVARVLREQPLQVPLVNSNYVIEQVSPAALHPTFSNAVLPRALKRSPKGMDPQRSNRRGNLEPVLPVPIKDQESGSRPERKCLADLLDDPGASRMLRHIEVQDSSSIMGNDKETVNHSERDCRDAKEVHCGDCFSMISQEREPAPCRPGISWSTFHPTGYGSFREVEAKHEQLVMNAWSAPSRIFAHHPENQFPNLLRSRLSANTSSDPRYQPPVHSEAGTMPADDSFGRHDDE
jgi:hypothetical protein